MSIFSSSWEYYAFAASASLFEKNDHPHTFQQIMLEGLRMDDTFANILTFSFRTDMYARSKAMVKYALKEDGYIRGLPSSDFTTFTIEKPWVAGAIDREVKVPVENFYWWRHGVFDVDFLVKMFIHDHYLDINYFPWPEDCLIPLGNPRFNDVADNWVLTNFQVLPEYPGGLDYGARLSSGTGEIVNETIGVVSPGDIITLTAVCNRGTALLNSQSGSIHLSFWNSIAAATVRTPGTELLITSASNTTGNAQDWVELKTIGTAPATSVAVTASGSAIALSTSFIFRIYTNDSGFTLPLDGAYSYDFYIDFGDGDPIEHITTQGEIDHQYFGLTGFFDISITGTCPRLNFSLIDTYFNSFELLEVKQWGSIGLKNVEEMFWGHYLLNVTATDAPDFTNIELTGFEGEDGASMYSMFRGTDLSIATGFGNWDVSKFGYFNYAFYGSYFEGYGIERWKPNRYLWSANGFLDTDDTNYLPQVNVDAILIGWAALDWSINPRVGYGTTITFNGYYSEDYVPAANAFNFFDSAPFAWTFQWQGGDARSEVPPRLIGETKVYFDNVSWTLDETLINGDFSSGNIAPWTIGLNTADISVNSGALEFIGYEGNKGSLTIEGTLADPPYTIFPPPYVNTVEVNCDVKIELYGEATLSVKLLDIYGGVIQSRVRTSDPGIIGSWQTLSALINVTEGVQAICVAVLVELLGEPGSDGEPFIEGSEGSAVRLDNFEWNSDQDPSWDEGHEDIELPVTNPTTGENYIAPNIALSYIQPIFSQAEFAEYQALNPDLYSQLPYGTESITFKLKFAYTDNLGNPQVWEMPGLIDLTQYTYGHWIIARYQKEDLYEDINPVEHLHTDYWTYLVGSYYDPILEALLFSNIGAGNFLPVVILMQDKQWYDFPYGDPRVPQPDLITGKTRLHATTDKILKKLALKGKDIKSAFLEQEEDESNPDNNTEKWDFFIHFATPINTQVPESIEYMFKFFERMIPFQQYTFEDYQHYLTTGGGIYLPQPGSFVGLYRWYREPQPQTTIHITEGVVTGYDVRYAWSYISEKTFSGQFLSSGIGENTLLQPGQASIQLFEHRDNFIPQYLIGLKEMHGDDVLWGKVGNDAEYGYHDYVIFTRQFAERNTEGEIISYHYKRILVMALSQEYTINTRSDQGVGGSGEGPHKLQKVDISLFDPDEPYGTPLEAFRIPVHIETLRDMSWLHREPVVSDSLTYTVFLVHKEKVKWYESGFFKAFIIIVAIILIIIVTYYGMYNIAEGLSVAIFGASSSALTIYVTYAVLAFAIGSIVSMAGEAIGGIWGTVFVVIASIAMAGRGSSSSVPGSWGNAVNYLNTAKPYLMGAQKIYAHYESDQLAKDWEQFMLTTREREQQLEDAWADLDTPNWLNPLYLIRAEEFKAETPENYLSRTKDPNPGVTANNVVHDFVRMALDLPEDPMEKDIIQEMFIGFKKQSGAE